MNIYEPLVEMLESNKVKFGQMSTAALIKHGYLADEPLAIEAEQKETRAAFEVMVESIRTGDSTAWRKASSTFGDEINKEGRSIKDFEKLGEIYTQIMKDIVEEAFPDQPKLKAIFLRRIESLMMVGNVSAITSVISKKHTS